MSVSALYLACYNGDLDAVEELLPTLTLDEINQIEPNGSTSLHAACHYNHPQIVKLLLDSGALRTTLNSDGRTAFDEATSEQVKALFPRSFADGQARFSNEISEQAIEWTSLGYGSYGWRFKQCRNNMDIYQAVDGILGEERFQDISTTHLVEYLLNKARHAQDPKCLLQAYSTGMGFCHVINKVIALGPLYFDEYDVEESYSLFIGVLRCHEALKKYRYTGNCYRGMKLSTEDFEKNYKVDNTLLIKPFISTSKSRDIAERFTAATSINSRPLSILCIYTIPVRTLSYNDNVALDISSISEYPDEEEVLILPYTSLQIQSINHLPSGIIEIEMEWYSYSRHRLTT